MPFFERALDLLASQAQSLIQLFTEPSSRLHVMFLGSAALLGVGVHLERRRSLGQAAGSLWGYLFPRQVYAHRSARTDYAFLVVSVLLYPLLVLPFEVSAEAGLGLARRAWGALSPGWQLAAPGGLGLDLLLTGVVLVVTDLGLFVAHYLFHRVPLLWEFHKVHHSAEVLTPITVKRFHPVEDVVTTSLVGILVGATQAGFRELVPATGEVIGPAQLNLGLFAFYMLGYHLRHTHVWLDFGPLERVFVSPAMHQLHHSVEPRHWDRNYGVLFSWWDRWAGSRVLARESGLSEGESLRFGIDGVEEAEYQGVLRLYLLPFVKVARRWPEMLIMTRPTRLLLLVVLLATSLFAVANVLQRPTGSSSVMLEELTWVEVRERVDAGWTTVIVPTGGTEQNGPHMALGKHNVVVRHTAGEVARRLGRALVAPVVAYVPEGEIEPPSGHMQLAGTLSVDEATFEAVLEQTARSLAAHGFQTICLLGDSGDSQAAQARVAQRLNAAWSDRPTRVIHLGDYYAANGQTAWLQAQGETEETIGRHAGIRDTSELLAIDPGLVRRERRAPMGGGPGAGVHGDPSRASGSRGLRLLELKIEAALRQLAAEGIAPSEAPSGVAATGSTQG